ncbi:ABC transporter permease subunit [Halocatena halophila]|uniref:ABC transporter permease subunit n=1 Tax=Halocatena halophila TaxID=2814576 RepID=UPI002ED2F26A
MTWTVIARKEFRDASRSKLLWLVVGLFVTFAGGAAYLYAQIPSFHIGGPSTEFSAVGLLVFLEWPVTVLVPVIGLLLGYKSIAGEIESGSVKLLLSLPHNRSAVVLGKLAGRYLVLTVGIIAGFLAASIFVAGSYPTAQVGASIGFVLVTIGLGWAYISIGTCISALTQSTTRAGALIFGAYFLFGSLWQPFGRLIHWATAGSFSFGFTGPPEWFVIFSRSSPNGAFHGVLSGLLSFAKTDAGLSAFQADPFYLSSWVAGLTLVGWVIAPILIGYLRFAGADV